MTRDEKMAKARRLLYLSDNARDASSALDAVKSALRLALGIIEDFGRAVETAWGPADSGHVPTPPPAGVPEEPALSPAPDFAGMAHQLADVIWNNTTNESEQRTIDSLCESWLKSNWPKPAPAVVRDDAWWHRVVRMLGAAVNTEWSNGLERKLVDLLRATFGQDPALPPALDVEEIRRSERRLAYEHAAEVVAHTFPTSDAVGRLRNLAEDYGSVLRERGGW